MVEATIYHLHKNDIEISSKTCIHNCLIIHFGIMASLFCFLGYFMQFPLELDPWKLLQDHILVDYTGHEVSLYLKNWLLHMCQLSWLLFLL